VNLCVGVIVDNYNEIKEGDGCNLLTKAQSDWIATHKSLHKRSHFFCLTDLPSKPRLQVMAYRVISSSIFENGIMLCICTNTVFMAMKMFPSPSALYEDVRGVVNQAFGAVFFTEMVIKLYALRWSYFKENWNRFDCMCVMSSVVGILLSVAGLPMALPMSAIRALRIARLFRLVKFLKGLNRMFTALILSMPKLINVGGILLLFFFLFSVLGVQLFAKTKFHGPHDIHANFRDPGRAFLTLLRSVTGEGWNEMMHALSRNVVFFSQSVGEACVPDDLFDVDKYTYPVLAAKCLIDEPSACGKNLSYPYFVAFTFIMSMVMVNLMIAVILEAFGDSSSNELVEVIETAIGSWEKYDRDLVMHLPVQETFMFVNAVALKHGVDLSKEPDSGVETSGRKRRLNKEKGGFLSSMGIGSSEGVKKEFDLSQVPLRLANLCEVKVLPDGTIHFLYAVRMAVALTLSGNVTQVLQEFEAAESKDAKLMALRQHQVKRLIKSDDEKSITLQEQVGAAKIQARFRSKHSVLHPHMMRRHEEAPGGAGAASASASIPEGDMQPRTADRAG